MNSAKKKTTKVKAKMNIAMQEFVQSANPLTLS